MTSMFPRSIDDDAYHLSVCWGPFMTNPFPGAGVDAHGAFEADGHELSPGLTFALQDADPRR